MDKIDKIYSEEQLQKNWQDCSNQSLSKEGNKTYISKYSGELTEQCITKNVAKIKSAFPGLPIEFYSILTDRISEKNFCDEKLNDSVNHVIDNCIYPTPTIAQFISFDKKKRLYTYNEMCKIVDDFGSDVWKYFNKEKINNITYWYRINK